MTFVNINRYHRAVFACMHADTLYPPKLFQKNLDFSVQMFSRIHHYNSHYSSSLGLCIEGEIGKGEARLVIHACNAFVVIKTRVVVYYFGNNRIYIRHITY